jgi:hypothetical protein
MISITQRGNFKLTETFFNRALTAEYLNALNRCGQAGIAALSAATPVDTGKTASSWDFKVVQTAKGVKIAWFNSNVNNGVPIAILIQYGHGTRNGGFVQGRDYINPAMKPIFDKLANDMWKEVTKL